MFSMENSIWSFEEYLDYICGDKHIVRTLDEFEDMFGEEIWNYPLDEVDHCMEQGGEYVIVEIPYYDDRDEKHRIFELHRVDTDTI